MTTILPSFCRFCPAMCGTLVHVDAGRVVRVEGDPDNPLFRGFTCPKGRAAPEQLADPERLLTSMKRMPDGTHQPIPTAQALDEIAGKLRKIMDEHGPRAVALFLGGYLFIYSEMLAFGTAFQQALGTPMLFHNGTIDQPGNKIAAALHGRWGGGRPPFEEADRWMLVGTNPIVSQWGGIPPNNPALVLKERMRDGLKLVVIDPRRTDVARAATIHIQPRPGEDASILAAMIHVILAEKLENKAFVGAETENVERLRAAVAPFTPDYAARRADVPAEQIVEAARLFASGTKGSVSGGTGTNMSLHGNVVEYLILCLNSLCGRWLRAGDRLPNPLAYLPLPDVKAQCLPKPPAWKFGEKMRIRGLEQSVAGMPTAALAEEILTPGEGQVRALITSSSNAVLTWPDQARTMAAFDALELSVAVDVRMSATAKMSDYVIASKLSYEVPGTTKPGEILAHYYFNGWERPYAMYTPRLVDPPEGADLIDMWEVYYELAQRLGLSLTVDGVALDMVRKPSSEELMELLSSNGRVPLDAIKAHPHGHIFDVDVRVAPRDPDCAERLDLGAKLMMDELAEVLAEGEADEKDAFPYRLVSRRMRNVFNSTGQHIGKLSRPPYNPAFMSPTDLAREGLENGDVVEIDSGHGVILGIVQPADDVREGVISMAHGYGDATLDNAGFRSLGSPTSRLIPVDRNFDKVTGIPRMSAIPVRVRALEAAVPTPS